MSVYDPLKRSNLLLSSPLELPLSKRPRPLASPASNPVSVVMLTDASPSSAVVKPTWVYNLIILVTTVAFFLLPMLVISVLYLLIGLRLHSERAVTSADGGSSFGPGGLTASHKKKISKRNLQVTKMLCRCHSPPVLRVSGPSGSSVSQNKCPPPLHQASWSWSSASAGPRFTWTA